MKTTPKQRYGLSKILLPSFVLVITGAMAAAQAEASGSKNIWQVNDSYRDRQEWYFSALDMPGFYRDLERATDTLEIKAANVAIIDTGIKGNHPDLKHNLLTDAGKTFIKSLDPEFSATLVSDNKTPPSLFGYTIINGNSSCQRYYETADPYQVSNGHGTRVAGLAGAQTDNGMGIASFAYPAPGGKPLFNMMAIKIVETYDHLNITDSISSAATLKSAEDCKNFYGSQSEVWKQNAYPATGARGGDTLKAIDYAVRYGTSPNTGVDVISMSLSGSGDVEAFEAQIKAANDKGIIVVSAAGNQCRSLLDFVPGAATNTLTVTATQSSQNNLTIADYTNYLPLPSMDSKQQMLISAPGGAQGCGFMGETYPDNESLYSTGWSVDYLYVTGTSMATPLISGFAATLKSLLRSHGKRTEKLTTQKYYQILADTAVKVDDVPSDKGIGALFQPQAALAKFNAMLERGDFD